MQLVAPSLLSADFSRLAEEIVDIEQAGANWIHLDIMDGHFVSNLTIGPVVVKAIRKCTQLPFDVHLMIEHPERYINAFVEAGADRITVHVEVCKDLNKILKMIKDAGIMSGVALNPATPLSSVEHVLGSHVDLVLLMTVNPGFGGQQFIPSVLPKITNLRKLITEKKMEHIFIEVDGGINKETSNDVIQAGANVLVSGNYIFNHENRKKAISQLLSCT